MRKADAADVKIDLKKSNGKFLLNRLLKNRVTRSIVEVGFISISHDFFQTLVGCRDQQESLSLHRYRHPRALLELS